MYNINSQNFLNTPKLLKFNLKFAEKKLKSTISIDSLRLIDLYNVESQTISTVTTDSFKEINLRSKAGSLSNP